MKRGRRWLPVNFGTGRRGRMPKRAIPEHTVEPMAQMRMVHCKPTLSNSAVKAKGKTKPIEYPSQAEPLARLRMLTAYTSSRKDDAASQASPFGEPLAEQFDDRDI